MIKIQSSRLQAEILEPGDPQYARSRFNWCGFVAGVTLDDAIKFAEPEQIREDRANSMGQGLCSEYVDTQMWQEAPEGGKYPKFGVGLLDKTEQPYYRMDFYSVTPFPVHWQMQTDCVTFYTDPMPCNGYAMWEKREVKVEENRLVITTTVRNEGEKTLDLEEYNHNFSSINHLPIDDRYRIELPGALKLDEVQSKGNMRGKESVLYWTDVPQEAFFADIRTLDPNWDVPYAWKMTHAASNASVQEQVDFVPSRIAVWGVEHCACPEIFIHLCLEPGEEKTWTRIWTFEG